MMGPGLTQQVRWLGEGGWALQETSEHILERVKKIEIH